MRVLIVEDDRALAAALADAFASMDITAEIAATSAEAEDLLAGYAFDVVVLDLGLPDEDGLSLLRRLRSGGNHIPVLVLSARSHPQSCIEGLNAGADDYLGKPILFAELKARIEAVMRRVDKRASDLVMYGDFAFDLGSLTASVAGTDLALSLRERRLLELLLRRNGRTATVALVQDHLCGPDQVISPNALEVTVHRLRKKLGTASAGIAIENVRGVGYRLLKA
ncbi:MAG: response regulator [Sphingomonadales bacterium]|nr:response regulator [Sphingomonadales bacterium]